MLVETILNFLSQKVTNKVVFLAMEEAINHAQRTFNYAEDWEEKEFEDYYPEELKKVRANQDGVN